MAIPRYLVQSKETRSAPSRPKASISAATRSWEIRMIEMETVGLRLNAEHDGNGDDQTEYAAEKINAVDLAERAEIPLPKNERRDDREEKRGALYKEVGFIQPDLFAQAGVHNPLDAHRHSGDNAE